MRVHVLFIRERVFDPFLLWIAREPMSFEQVIATFEVPHDLSPEKVTEDVKERIFPLQFQKFEHGDWHHVKWATGVVEGGYQLAGISEPLSELRHVFGKGFRLATREGHEIARGGPAE